MTTATDLDLLYEGVAALAVRLRDRDLSPVALAEACLARAESVGPRLGAVVTLTRERALGDARAAEEAIAAGRWRGPLHGIPYGLKDVIDTAGIRTTWGAAPYAARVPERDATVAARLAEAGGVLAAKLATIELAGALGYASVRASLTGPCRTPWDLSRWASGSSSGPGAAVAAGIVPYALATETWGSILAPAAWCGVTGLRPTYGLVSRRGVAPVAFSMDKVGVMARSAADCAAVLPAIAGTDPRDPSTVAAPAGLARVKAEVRAGLRVGVLALPIAPEPAPPAGYAAAWEAAQEVFRAAGALLSPATLPDFPWEPLATLVLEAEAAAAHHALIASGGTRALSDPSHATKGPGDYAPRASATDYVRAQLLRAEGQALLGALFTRFDLLLAPCYPETPPLIDDPGPLVDAPDPLGAAGNVAGLPAVALPIGFDGAIPLSAQLVAAPFEEPRLLAAAMAFQARTDHHLRRPPEPGPSDAAPPPAVATVTTR